MDGTPGSVPWKARFSYAGGYKCLERRKKVEHTQLQALHARVQAVRTPILGHIDPACNTSYHLAASRTVLPRVPPYLARDRLRLLAHAYDSVASIHMTKNPGRHG